MGDPVILREPRQNVSGSPVRNFNQDRILETLRRDGVASRRELAERTGLSRSTVTAVLRDLTASGAIEIVPPSGREELTRGRRPEGVRVARSLGLLGGVDYGHAHVRAALATTASEIIAESAIVRMNTNSSPQQALTTGRDLLAGLLEHHYGLPLLAVGVGLPSPVDPSTGIISDSKLLPNWADTDPSAVLSEYLGVPVWIDNDANLGALAELRGTPGAPGNMIFVKASTGIGAGLVFGGRVYRGTAGTSGEVGHVPVSSEQNLCRCGSRGCLETVVSLPRLIEDLRNVHPGITTADDMFDLVRRGDAAALRVVGDAGTQIGRTLADIANVLAPDAIVVGGDMAAAGAPFLGALEHAVRQSVQAVIADALTVRLSTFGSRSEIVGAVYLAAEHARLSRS
jgi:predicted NBD/HSP70 family sugar kinase